MMKDRDLSGEAAIAAIQYGKEGEYWLKKFSGDLKRSGFPYDYDYSISTLKQERKDSIQFEFNGTCVSKLMQLSKGLDHRLYIILTAGLVVLLHKYTGNHDIIIGSPIFKQEIEGDFINTTLPLRNQLDDNMTFKELLLDRVRQTIVEASEYQNYPLESLLFQLNLPYSEDEFPLFDVAILLENIHDKKYILHTYPKIIFSFLRTNERIQGTAEYNALLYDKTTIEGIVTHFKRMMDIVILNANIPICEIDILSDEEKRQTIGHGI
jgi:non-ribosomal peptide synthetase component F